MNLSTGIKSRASALEILAKLLAETLEEHLEKLAPVQRDFGRLEHPLEHLALNLAIERIQAQPETVQVINATIRTSAGPKELISIHIEKH